MSFVNAVNVKKVLQRAVSTDSGSPHALVLDASAINDLDATGADMLKQFIDEFDAAGIDFHVAAVKGPVRDVMQRAGLWDGFAETATPAYEALLAIRSSGTRG
ncbi:MAG: sodium-independent anion transporter [Acidimicrobiales bacterium]